MGSDDAPATDASQLTPEEKRGPRTIHVALFLLATLLIVSVLTEPTAVLPRDSTLHDERHVDDISGLEVSIPVGWRVDSTPEFGSVEIVPTDAGGTPETRILAGRLDEGIAAAAITDAQGAATALAETVQLYVMEVNGSRDDQRTHQVSNEVGEGAAVSYVVVPSPTSNQGSGGLVYAAVFGNGDERWWLSYMTSSQGSAPGPDWVDQIVDDVRLAG